MCGYGEGLSGRSARIAEERGCAAINSRITGVRFEEGILMVRCGCVGWRARWCHGWGGREARLVDERGVGDGDDAVKLEVELEVELKGVVVVDVDVVVDEDVEIEIESEAVLGEADNDDDSVAGVEFCVAPSRFS